MNSQKHTSPIKEIPFNDKRKTHQQDALKTKKTNTMLAGASIDALDPKRTYVPLLVAAMEQD
jgi:hypothetical protein